MRFYLYTQNSQINRISVTIRSLLIQIMKPICCRPEEMWDLFAYSSRMIAITGCLMIYIYTALRSAYNRYRTSLRSFSIRFRGSHIKATMQLTGLCLFFIISTVMSTCSITNIMSSRKDSQ